MFAICLCFVLSATGCQRSAPPLPTSGQAIGDAGGVHVVEATEGDSIAVGVVTFVIHDGESVIEFKVDDVPDGTTLESVMRQVEDVPISIRGSGVTAFVDQIGDTGTGSSEGWTYKVDGEFAHRGIGETTLSPPTTVQWSYGSMPDP